MPRTIVLKRAYEEPTRGDGYRILVDRLCPRGSPTMRQSGGVSQALPR
jgi:uncharacterized protein YeaO (DUF488 family)